MRVTYNSRVIEARQEDGMYYAYLDGLRADVPPAKYRRAVINRTIKMLQDQERISTFEAMKEAGL